MYIRFFKAKDVVFRTGKQLESNRTCKKVRFDSNSDSCNHASPFKYSLVLIGSRLEFWVSSNLPLGFWSTSEAEVVKLWISESSRWISRFKGEQVFFKKIFDRASGGGSLISMIIQLHRRKNHEKTGPGWEKTLTLGNRLMRYIQYYKMTECLSGDRPQITKINSPYLTNRIESNKQNYCSIRPEFEFISSVRFGVESN